MFYVEYQSKRYPEMLPLKGKVFADKESLSIWLNRNPEKQMRSCQEFSEEDFTEEDRREGYKIPTSIYYKSGYLLHQ